MKIKFDHEKKTKLFFAGALIVFAMAVYFVMSNMRFFAAKLGFVMSVLTPFFVGAGIAYVLWRPVKKTESLLLQMKVGRLKKPISQKAARAVSIVAVYLLMIAALTLVGVFIVPQLKDSLVSLYWKMPGFIRSLEASANSIIGSMGFTGDIYEVLASVFERFWGTISKFVSDIVPMIVNTSLNITSAVTNIILGIIVSIYMLNSKEVFAHQTNKVLTAILSDDMKRRVYTVGRIFDDTFGGYINGQITDAIVVGLLCFAMMLILRLPFALLISTIVMITNVIPMIGPFIGAVPSAFIILMAGSPMKLLIFVVMILVLQQIDGNILVPRIVGSSTGLSGFWVLFAVIVGGELFGILGIVLSVPTLSVILKLMSLAVNKRIAKKQEKAETAE